MIIRFIKNSLQRFLGLFGLRLSQVPVGGLTGTNLFEDLGKLIQKESPVCLDVGANVGQTIIHLSRAFKTPYIHAFEPSSEIFTKLEDNCQQGKLQANLYNFALGRTDETREFINYARPCLSSFLKIEDTVENRYKDIVEKNREQVKVSTVDQFISDQKMSSVDLLKIDTQGFDLDVLLGAEQALKSKAIKLVLIELTFVSMYEKQALSADVTEYLNKNGLYLIDYYEKIRQSHTLAWCTALFGRR